MIVMINTRIYSDMSITYANTTWIIMGGIMYVILQKNKYNSI